MPSGITLQLDRDPLAVHVRLRSGRFTVDLDDGRSLAVPLDWFPRLAHAKPAERRNWQLLGGGYAIEWPDLDEHIGIEGLVAGRRSGESPKSFERWLSERTKHSKRRKK